MPTKKIDTNKPAAPGAQTPEHKVKKGNPDKIRCPHDHHICTRVPDGRGGTHYRCPRCNRTYTS